LWRQAADLARDGRRDPGDRARAVRLLAHAPWTTAGPVLAGLAGDEPVQEVRLAAVRALAAHPRPEVPGLLIRPWPGYTPAARREVLEVMLQQPDRIQFLFREIEAGRVKPADFDPQRLQQLRNHPRAEIRERAARLLRDTFPEERRQVLTRYRAALDRKGDPERGREVFRKNCATCHCVAGFGVTVGPDISDTRTRTAEQLLFDILNPNAAIDSNYINYVVTTRGGKVLTGILAAETASSITLRRAESQTDVVLRRDIEEMRSTSQSLMPEGLEKNISIPDMADLLAFLKNWRYLGGTVPLGRPTPSRAP
jgi:putative heme-binding domain-containing protein